MPDPFADPFTRMMNPGSFLPNSYAALFAQKPPTANSLLPQVDPESERSTVGWLMEQGLGGLGYVGSLLDKTFGGRALRGVLGGNTNEALSALPLSDTLGLTDPSQEIAGRDLLSHLGVTSQRQPGESFNWQDDLLGMAAEVALDPSTYLSLGLTGVGKGLAKTGGLASGFGNQLRAGQRGLTFKLPFSGMEPLELLSGQNVLAGASGLRSLGTLPTRGIDAGLNALTGLQPLSGLQQALYRSVGEPLSRFGNRLFDPAVKAAGTAEGQQVGRVMDVRERELEALGLGGFADRQLALNNLAGSPARMDPLQRAFTAAVETADKPDLHNALTQQARQDAAQAIGRWHTPLDVDEADNLAKWLKGDESLSGRNQQLYQSQVKPFDKMLLEGQAPQDAVQLNLLHAGRDLIDSGYQAAPAGDAWRFTPSDDLIRRQKQDILDKVLSDTEHGPAAFVNEPGYIPRTLEERKALGQPPVPSEALPYYKGLQDFADTVGSGLDHPLFQDPKFGAAAQEAVRKATDAPSFKQVPLAKALEYVPAKGNTEPLEWAAKNLNPDEMTVFNDLVSKEKHHVIRLKEIEKATGAQGGGLTDSLVSYFTRQQTKFPAGDPRNAAQPSLAGYFKDLAASNKSFAERKEIFRDVPGGTSSINAWTVNPEISGAARTKTKEQVEAFLREQLTGMDTPAKSNPAWKQAQGLAKWLEDLPPVHATEKVPFFTADIPQLMYQRQRGANKVVATSDAFYDAFKRFGNTEDYWKTQGRETVSARDLATQMNLTGADEAGSIAAQKLAQKAGLPPLAQGEKYTINDLKDLHLPADVAKDMLNFNKGFQTPEILKPVLDLYDQAVNLTKTYLTRPFLSFHTRNLATGLFNTWRSGALDGQTMKDTVEFLRGRGEKSFLEGKIASGADLRVELPAGKDAAAHAAETGLQPGYWKQTNEILPGVGRDDFWKELVSNRIAFGPNTSQTADVLGAAGDIVSQGVRKPEKTGRTILGDVGQRFKEFGQEVKDSKGKSLNPLDTKNSFVQMMTEGGQQVEDFLRVNHYLGLRKQGWAPAAAADEVLKYQIDYSRLTGFEKSFAKRVLPWYSFSRGTLPPILEDLVSQPLKITAPVRATTGGRPQGEFVPQWIGEGAALPLGGNDDGTTRYLSSFGLPIEDESVKVLGSLLHGDVSRAGEQVLGAAFPWIKSPLEFTFNKQLFSGRPLTDLKPYEFASLGGLLNEKQARVLTEVAANTPASRTLSTLNTLTDPRKDVVDQLLSLTTGLKQTDVDYNRALDVATTKMIGEQLLGQPGVRSRQEVYVPVENIPGLSEADQVRLRIYMNAEQRLRDQAAARRKQ